MELLEKKVLIKAIDGKELFENIQTNKKFSFSSVVTDSRNVQQGSLFVPLVGEFQDGHKYVQQAAVDGACVILVCKSSLEKYLEIYKSLVKSGIYIIVVNDTLMALQSAAAAYVRQFPNLKKIAITGSSGKTTTKELIASVLKQKFNVIMTEGNLNSETGLPLSVFRIKECHQVGVFEMGMNRKGEISELADVLFPNISVVTNIGTAHIGILGTKDAIAQEKKQIFKNFSQNSIAFIPFEDDYAEFLSKNVLGKIIYYGRKNNNEQNSITNVISQGIRGTDFCLDAVQVHFPLPGFYNLHDAFAAIAVAKELKLSNEKIRVGLESVKPLFGRSQIIDGYMTVIQDCYNANLESMLQSIELCDQSDCKGKKVYILGDMLELGEKSAKSHLQVCEKIVNSKAQFVIFVGAEMCAAYKKSHCIENHYCIPELTDKTLQEAQIYLEKFLSKDDFILLKGSRGMKIERFTSVIEDICHRQGGRLNV